MSTTTTTTTQEKVGDIILGAHLVHCCHNTRFTPGGKLVLVRSPLQGGRGGSHHWKETQKRPGGWERKVEHVLDTSAEDPTRATSEFEVVRVRRVPTSDPGFMGRDAGYGGGIEITVRRRGGKDERIVYTRSCCFDTDVSEAAQVVSSRSP